MAKKAKKIVIKKSIETTATLVSRRMLVVLMIGLAVVVGFYAYSTKRQAKPVDVMAVNQPNNILFSDKFGDGQIARRVWNVNKSDGVVVTETQSDNLRMNVPSGAINGKIRSGVVVYKESVSEGQDFVMRTRLYKPVVNGVGVGRTGIRFAGVDGNESEGVAVYWEVNGTTSEVVFVVNTGDTNVATRKVAVSGSQAELVLKRIGTEYLAAYKMDNFDDDTPYEEVGNPIVSAGQFGGKIRLFTNNGGVSGAYPRVLGRFDSFSLRSNTGSQLFNDNFAEDGALEGSKWVVTTRGVAGRVNKTEGNLVMSVVAATKPATGEFIANTVRAVSNINILKDKRGVAVVELFKPKVTGSGSGVVGLNFSSESNKSEESAGIRWIVTGSSSSRLVFVVRNASGKIEERETINVPSGRNRMTVRLMHGDGVYRAMYRFGADLDDDIGMKVLGSEKNPKLGAKGSFMIFTTQVADGGGNAPAVVGRFDSFRVSYY